MQASGQPKINFVVCVGRHLHKCVCRACADSCTSILVASLLNYTEQVCMESMCHNFKLWRKPSL